MRYIIYGAGGIGGVIGARLFQHGHEVILICRGAHLTAIQQRGLTLKTPNETVQLAVRAVGHPAEIAVRADDVVLLAMKSQDTESALRDLARVAGNNIPIVCAQNGVDNERMAARRFARVYGMVVWMPATYLEPGLVLNHTASVGGILDAGCYPRGVDSVIAQLTSDLGTSGFSAQPDPDIMRWKYTKLLSNLRNALQAICGLDARGGDIARAARQEALACYKAAGIEFVPEDELQQRVRSTIKLADIDGHPRGGGSSWQSLERGLPSIEADYLNGEIVLLGRLHGVSTPYNCTLQRVANEIVQAGRPAGSISVEEFQRIVAEG